MANKLIITKKNKQESKEIKVFTDPENLKPLTNKTSFKILKLLSQEELYPMQIAKKLGVHEQKIYYHIRNLVKNGLLIQTRTEERKGGLAKYYKTSSPVFALDLGLPGSAFNNHKKVMSAELSKFFKEFHEKGVFSGRIVVGSPDEHGPYQQRSRDGHYVGQLAMFLGQYFELPRGFVINLDVDVKAERLEKNNLILIGGPVSNIITHDLKQRLPIQFGKKLPRQIIGKTTYNADTCGMICKIKNPYDKSKAVIVIAGVSAVGTKAAIIGLTNHHEEVLNGYSGGVFSRVVKGLDLNGDGKVDSIEVLE